ncbi:DUF4129 domain-containing protein [Ilyomonas limi]|uniref:DUF4129 domain-containing protein n=1 Tax=Ilyomonas limi TaxID=2575867 RepID=A0A4V5UUA1_9BACT|nr:DUF4129 domain-containing protein [Ilyomonas limi]TKK66683.1 DUF4129 domain-containing protein [Ilyomonas limi]
MKNQTHIAWLSRWVQVLILLLAGILHGNAQEGSSAYSDTTITDTVTSSQSEAHIYDTSQNFFNWKEEINQPYSQSKIQSRVRADKEVNNLKEEDDFWYVKSIEKFKSSPEVVKFDKAQKDSLSKNNKATIEAFQFSEVPSWIGTFMWGIIIAIFLFAVIYFLLVNKINIFSRNSNNNASSAVDSEVVDLFKIPYQELLQKAYSEKNYRLAVRILYLQTLKLLSEKNIITFQADYTNMDYLQQLSHTMFYKDFFAITRHYEYAWYGGFTVSEPAFYTIQNDFHTIQNKILHR